QDTLSGELAPRAASRSARGGRGWRAAQAHPQPAAALRQVAARECLLSMLAVAARAVGATALRQLQRRPFYQAFGRPAYTDSKPVVHRQLGRNRYPGRRLEPQDRV